jgi:hypothetical protein
MTLRPFRGRHDDGDLGLEPFGTPLRLHDNVETGARVVEMMNEQRA